MPNETLEGYHLSSQQQRLWQLRQDSDYRWQCGVWLEGPCDVQTLAAALGRVVARHEILRTVFHSADDLGLTLQVVTDGDEVKLCEEDLSHLSPAQQESALEEHWRGELSRGFDYRRGPLVRATLLKLSAASRLLVFSAAAICADALTLQNLLAELRQQYAALSGDERYDPDEPLQYADYAAWLNELLESSEQHEARAYWGAAAEVRPVRLPLERKAKADENGAGAVEQYRLQLDGELAARVEELAAKMRAEVSDVLLAAWATLLWRLTGERDVSVEVCFDGRKYDYLRPALGCFAQYLPVLCRFEDYRFDEVVELVRDAVASAHTRQEYYGAEERARRDAAAPSGGVGFDYRERAPGSRAGALRVSEWRAAGRGERLKLRLSAEGGAGGLELRVECEAGLYGVGEAERLCGRLAALLGGAAAGAGAAASSLPALGDGEREQVLYGWNETAAPYPSHLCLHSLFERQAALTPAAVALTSEAGSLTYGELDGRANRLARHLLSLGVGVETLVGVLMERSAELVVSLLAVLKAGGAYLPLDPSYPRERLALMLEDAGVGVLLTQGRLLDAAAGHAGATFCVDEGWAEVAGLSGESPGAAAGPDNLAYVIYTSGSTGRPKGVMIPHRGICNRLLWMQETYGLTPADAVLQKTPYGFDVSVWEFFWPLIAGARLVVARPGGHQESDYLAALVGRERVTVLHFVPSMLRQFLEDVGAGSCAGVRAVICSGEALSRELQARFEGRLAAGLHNLYGPTEASVDVSAWACERGSGRRGVPIGRPVTNTQLYVLDGGMEPVAVGVAGELYIGGVQLGRGYLGRAGQWGGGKRGGGGADGRAVRARPVRGGGRGASLPDGRHRAPPERRGVGVPGAGGRSGEGARAPHRVGGGGGRVGRARAGARVRGRGARGRPRRQTPRRLPGRAGCRREGGRRVEKLSGRALAGVHGAVELRRA
jgi:amino acid adenylation domain-containing protein